MLEDDFDGASGCFVVIALGCVIIIFSAIVSYSYSQGMDNEREKWCSYHFENRKAYEDCLENGIASVKGENDSKAEVR